MTSISLSEKVLNILPYCASFPSYDDFHIIEKEYNMNNMAILPFIYNKFGYETTYSVLNHLFSPDLYRQILSEEQFMINEEKSNEYWHLLISSCIEHLGVGDIIKFASFCKYTKLRLFINEELINLIESNYCYMILYFMKFYHYYFDLTNRIDAIVDIFFHDHQIINLLCDPFFNLNIEEIKAKILLKKLSL